MGCRTHSHPETTGRQWQSERPMTAMSNRGTGVDSSGPISAVWQANAADIGLLYSREDGTSGAILRKNETRQPLASSAAILTSLLPLGDNLLEVTRCGLDHTLTLRSRSYQVIASRHWHSQMKHLLSASLDSTEKYILLCTSIFFTGRSKLELETVSTTTLETVPIEVPSLADEQSCSSIRGCFMHGDEIWRVTDSAIEVIDGSQTDQPAARIPLKSTQHLIHRSLGDLCFFAGLDQWIEIASLTAGTSTVAMLPPGESFKEPVGMDVLADGSKILVLVAFRRSNSSECFAHQWSISCDGTNAVMRF